MMKIAGGWSSSTVAEAYISRSKRTILQVADGIGLNKVQGYTVPETVTVGDSNEPPTKKQKHNETTIYNIGVQNTYHIETMAGNFYIGLPPNYQNALATTQGVVHEPSDQNMPPLILRIPTKKM